MITVSKWFARAYSTPPRHLHRIAGRHAHLAFNTHGGTGVRREHLDARALTDHLQLVDGARPLEVTGDEDGVPLLSQPGGRNLPARVVLPAPCRPASMITVGGVLASVSRRVSPPRMLRRSSSLTILTTCCAGFQRTGDLPRPSRGS